MAKRIPNPQFRTLHFEVQVPNGKVSSEQMASILEGVVREALPIVNPVPAGLATWRTLKQRKAGKGYACTVAGAANCGRKDLRTPLNTGSHTLPDGHFPR